MNRFFLALSVLTLAGCEQARPPSPEVVAARTATGPENTNFETRMQPEAPRAGETSIWNFKVFDVQNKPDGTRKEWKFFNALPQSSNDKSTNEVLMNVWLISKNRDVFLPQKPRYGQYGSFLTDWTIPVAGKYTLWAQYQPVVAKDELSFADLKKAPALPVENARWDVSVAGTASAPPLAPKVRTLPSGEEMLAVYSLEANSYGTRAAFEVMLRRGNFRLNQQDGLDWGINKEAQISDESITMLSPDAKTLRHFVGDTLSVSLAQKGKWRVWFSFALDGKLFAAPADLAVS